MKTNQQGVGWSKEKQELLEARLRSKLSSRSETRTVSESRTAGPRPLSIAQESLWFIDQLVPNSPLYNIPQAFRLNGRLNPQALRLALEAIVRRHEIIRSKFISYEGRPMQIVTPDNGFALPLIDLSSLPPGEREEKTRHYLDEEAKRPFNLAKDLMLRASLLRLDECRHILLLSVHHIAADVWSLGILYKELSILYDAFSQGEPSPLPALKVQYADVSEAQSRQVQNGAVDKELSYWKHQLAGEWPLLALPVRNAASAKPGFRGARQSIRYPVSLLDALQRLSRREGTTLYATLLAAFQTLLHRYSGQPRILVGSPIGARTESEAERLIGLFLHMTVLRADFSSNPSFSHLLGQVRESVLGAFAHQSVPLERIIEELKLPRLAGRNPFFQAVFQFLATPAPQPVLHGISVAELPMETGTAKFALTLTLMDSPRGLTGDLEYNAELFDSATVSRMINHFQTLLEAITADPSQPIGSLPLITRSEECQLLAQWNNTATPYPRNAPLASLFEKQAAATPERIALEFEDRQMSYGQLNARANQLARFLQKSGVSPGAIVGVCMERSLDLIVALLAILKAGAAYVPLDPNYPGERLEYMIADTGAPVIVTTVELSQKIFSGKQKSLVCIDELSERIAKESAGEVACAASGDSLAYIIYTSGSTGRPKGVAVPQRGIVRLVKGANYISFSADDVFLLFAPISFDASTFEIWGPLLNGAKLVIFPPYLTSLEQLGHIIQRYGITTLWLTAGLFHQMVEHHIDRLEGLRFLLAGGDVLSATQVAKAVRHLPNTQLINGYGPTENTTFTSCFAVPPGWNDSSAIPIGSPISNTQIYILDQYRNMAPIGVVGELYIGGDGLARGYLNAPELTAEKFVPNPFTTEPGSRLYRTGDLARWLPDGNIAFLGRVDQQLKIRGFRVEPAEIEFALAQHPAVRETVVTARQDGLSTKHLVAYVTLKPEKQADAGQLRTFLEDTLPRHLVPSHFVFLESLPLTANGKMDRSRLPAPADTVDAKQDAPRTEEERLLLQIWSEVLGRHKVGIHDNFFECGGHSLLATRLISRVAKVTGKEIPLRDIFDHPTIASLAEVLEKDKGKAPVGASFLSSSNRDPSMPTPLSFAQQRLWFIDQVNPHNPLYNVPLAWRFHGELNIGALEQSLQEVISRHEVLRTNFVAIDGTPAQKIASRSDFVLPLHDFSTVPEGERALSQLLESEAVRPFDLQNDLMLRALLVRLGDQDHVLFLNVHHIAFDEWSQEVLEKELARLYDANCNGRAHSPLPPLPLHYADYALWQRERLTSEALKEEIDYWTSHLAGAQSLEIPADRPRSGEPSHRGALLRHAFSRDLASPLKALSQRQGVTLNVLLLAALDTLLYRYTSCEDIVLGTPVAGRTQLETEPLLGFFVNTLAIRADLSGDPPFLRLLERVRRAYLSSLAHQETPFEKVVEKLHPGRNALHHPLFEIAFAVQHHAEDFRLAGVKAVPILVHTKTAKFNITLVIEDRGEELSALLEYNTDLFDIGTMRGFLGHFQTLLESIVANPMQNISCLPILTISEQIQILDRWNCTDTEFPRDRTVHQVFETQSRLNPEALAIVFGKATITYRELDGRSSQLARYLRRNGVGPDVLVGCLLERSIDMFVVWLAILKAGGAYVPLDPDYPPERLGFIIQETEMPVLVTTQTSSKKVPAGKATVFCLDSDWHDIGQEDLETQKTETTSAENLAYVIYTSGSTGKPKGVAVPHRAIVRLLFQTNYIQLDATDRIAQASNSAFDAATFEVWGSLLHGGCLVGVPKETLLSPAEFAAFLRREKISAMFLTTALFNQVAAEAPAAFHPLKCLLFGGEACDPKAVRQVLSHNPPRRLLHVYGPTETTTFATWNEIEEIAPDAMTVPIGRPIANTTAYVLDKNLQPLPVGVPGQLCLGGPGLARGYYRRAELTEQKFVRDPFARSGENRLYKTGDLARYLPNGKLEFVGRLDHQVKIRGFRIELEEVESLLKQAPGVRDAIVEAREDSPGDKRLAAYYIGEKDFSPSVETLREFLKNKLPAYMIPSSFQLLGAFPLTPNGKVNREALPKPGFPANASPHLQPRTELEIRLHQVWQEVLGHSSIGIQDDFFEVGGHSLLAVKLVTQIEKAIGIKLPLPILFQAATIEKLAEALGRNALFTPGSCLVRIQPDGCQAPIFWPHTLGGGAGGGLFTYRKLARLLGPDQPSYGFVAPAHPFTTIEEMAEHYIAEMKRIQPSGPYHLGGYCFAGVVAYEMACQLEEHGEKVAFLALLDSAPPDPIGNGTRFSLKLLFHFLRTLPSWVADFALNPRQLMNAIRWKVSVWSKRLFAPSSSSASSGHGLELEELVDMSAYPQEYRRFAQVHWDALVHYSPRPFHGRAVLFKGEDRHLFRLDGVDGWRKLIRGGIEIRPITGKHEAILADPCVETLASRLLDSLKTARRASSCQSAAAQIAELYSDSQKDFPK